MKLTLLVLLGLSLPTPALADDYVVIHNARAGAAPLSRTDLRGLFTGKLRAVASGAVVVVLPPDTAPAYQWLADAIFGVSSKLLASKIKQEVFKGDMNRPLLGASDAEVIAQVKEAPGGFGVVSTAAAQSLPPQVTVVKVE
jgi:hypothetical protein